jgi:hypothetical protein
LEELENSLKQKPFSLPRLWAPVDGPSPEKLDTLKVGLSNDLKQDQRFERMFNIDLIR